MFVDEIILTNIEYKLISDLVLQKYGIILNEKKRSLISSRLQDLLKKLKLKSFNDYYNLVIKDITGERLLELIDKLSTNHTYFFREQSHFDLLQKEIIPKCEKKFKYGNYQNLRIWSAGSSSGEEVYTLKILFEEYISKSIFKFIPLILGTDISTTALKQAIRGEYLPDQLKHTNIEWITKYFNVLENNNYQVKEKLKNDILFKRLNLRNDFPQFKNKFDIIFCRNVMIYFSEENKRKLISKFADSLIDGGYLFIGLSETLGLNNPYFKYISPSVYRKKRYDNTISFEE